MSKVKSLKFATEVSWHPNIGFNTIKNVNINISPQPGKYVTYILIIFQAAITILRIDDLIKLEPEKGEEKSYQQAYADGSLEG